MDQNEFFRVATIAICSDLRVENALRDFAAAVSNDIPVDHVFLQIYETDLAAVRTIASATPNDCRALDQITPMPKPVQEVVRANYERISEGFVSITSEEQNPVAARMLEAHGLQGSSIVHMSLSVEGGRLCNIVLTARGANRYSPQHAELLGLLKEPFRIALFNTLTHRELLSLRDRLADDNRFLNSEIIRNVGDEIIGAEFGLREVMQQVEQVAGTDSPVLLTGETGVGKDVIASAIHRTSARRSGPFIAVNCGAIPDSLIDSELFGHERGAFTGALTTRRGRFERAHGGTILLDEIGEMPLGAQVRLLRVLQNREIERIGGTEQISVDARVIAATNRDLPGMVAAGEFREDLWFRLNVFPINVPPLRERTVDISPLVQFFITRKARDFKLHRTPSLAPGVIEELRAYSWPGNVRELENIIERAIIVSAGEDLRMDLGSGAQRVARTIGEAAGSPGDFPTLDQVEKEHIERALAATGGTIHGADGAGALLGINPNTLRHRMRKLDIAFGRKARV